MEYKKRRGSFLSHEEIFSRHGPIRRAGNGASFPSCILPIIVACIFVFTVSQLVVIHRTIESYKSRHKALSDSFNMLPNESQLRNDLKLSKKFAPTWSDLLSTPPLFITSQTFQWNKISSSYKFPFSNKIKSWSWNGNDKEVCSKEPKTLNGKIEFDVNKEVSWDEIIQTKLPSLEIEGFWSPKDCQPLSRVAVIIPYRDRLNHLKTLLSILHPMLQRQKLAYKIFVAEQHGNYSFNKGAIMNAAFLLALNSSHFDCVIFHDVDLLPQNDHNIYTCEHSPSHLSVAVDIFDYRLPYSSLVGGVFAIKISHFMYVNGYSNYYWGYGAEDDDMFQRLSARGLKVSRPDYTVAKYSMIRHGQRLRNKFISPLIRTAKLRYGEDGLNKSRFKLVSSFTNILYTHFVIDVGRPSYFVQRQLKHVQLHNDNHQSPHEHIESVPNNITGSDVNNSTLKNVNQVKSPRKSRYL